MKQRKKSFGMRISAFVLSFAMVCTMLAGVNVVAFAADSDDELTDSVSVLRAYNPNNGEHLMTIDETEYNANVARGYDGEGEAWVAPLYSETEVWRAYNPNSGEHMLAPEAEVKALEAAGWQNEGLKMYSDDAMGTPIYRVFNPNATDAGSHHYCGEEEAAALVELGWQWDNNGEPVIYGVEEEQPVVLVNLTDASQLSANTIYVEFDQDASLLVDKDDITVGAADGTLAIPVNKMTFDEDGMGAVLELSMALQDEKDYAVALNDSEITFTASVGEVATIALLTASATQNVETPIEFALFDDMGVDVTSTVNIDATCSVSVDGGSDVSANTSQASKSTITMGTVGDMATVTITYTDGDNEDVTTTGIVTCIEPEATVGMGIWYDVPAGKEAQYINKASGCAKFYWGLYTFADPVSVEENKQNDDIFFCAVDETQTPIEYDSYSVQSSNDDVVSATSNSDTGKYVKLSVVGNTEGTANVVITATKNGKDTAYTVPVTVTKEGKLKNVKIKASRTSMSNAYDENYGGSIDVTAVDTNGNEITNFAESYELADENTKGGANHMVSTLKDTVIASNVGGFRVDALGNYTAWGDQGGTQTIKIEVSKDDVVLNRTQTVKVVPIAEAVWNDGDSTPANISYYIEMADSTVDPADPDQVGATTARLAAKYGSQFVGYVKDAQGTVGNHKSATSGSAIDISTETQLSNVKYGIKYGANYSATGKLYNSAKNIQADKDNLGTYTGLITIQTMNADAASAQSIAGNTEINAYMDATNSQYDFWFAKAGGYTVLVSYTMNQKDASQTANLTVKNGFIPMNPKVTVTKRVVDDLSEGTITEALTTLVDMNNNTSAHASIVDLAGTWAKDNNGQDVVANGNYTHDFTDFQNLSTENSRVTVKYAVVKDNITEMYLPTVVPTPQNPSGTPALRTININFMVPINSTFRTV